MLRIFFTTAVVPFTLVLVRGVVLHIVTLVGKIRDHSWKKLSNLIVLLAGKMREYTYTGRYSYPPAIFLLQQSVWVKEVVAVGIVVVVPD